MRLFRSRTQGPRPEDGYERADVSPGGIAVFALLFVVGLALHVWGLWALMRWFFLWDPPARYAPGPPEPPVGSPRLVARPEQLYREYEAEQHRLLTEYGWTDRRAGLARIPLERALEILAERGAPPWPTEGDAARGGGTTTGEPAASGLEESR